MSQCLACGKLCAENTLFCDECRSALLNRFQRHEQDASSPPREPSIHTGREQAISLYTSLPPQCTVDQSPDSGSLSRMPTLPDTGREQDLSQLLPDAWPEFEQSNMHSAISGDVPSQIDPLAARHVPLPDHSMSEPVNARVPSRRSAFAPAHSPRRPHRVSTRRRAVRNLLIVLALLTVIALLADLLLLSMYATHKTGSSSAVTLPTLTVSPGMAMPGQIVRLHITHFPALTDVFLSHDVQETVRTDVGSALLQVGPTGTLDVHILVENSWNTGIHTIEAEDVTTHYTASAILQVTGSGQMQPPRLALSQTMVQMGSGVQGQNSVQAVTLRNLGGGTISWFASSDQPWLFVTPFQGVFSDSQSVSIAVTRATLSPGVYHSTLSLQSNAGKTAYIAVTMSVLSQSSRHETVLNVIPPAQSFMAVDGIASNADNTGNSGQNVQSLTLRNPGSQPLRWDTTSNPPTVPFASSTSFTADTGWVQISPSEGTLAPGATTQVHVSTQSTALLPGVYNVLLHVSYSQSTTTSSGAAVVWAAALSPQPVAVSLTVQPKCGVATSMGMMTFTMVAGQTGSANGNSGTQSLGLSASWGCVGSMNWQASASASWLLLAPDRGQVQVGANATTRVSIQMNDLQPGTYAGFIVFIAGQRSQTVLVQLTVLAASSTHPQTGGGGQGTPGVTATATGTGTSSGGSSGGQQPAPPVLNISSSNLNFTATQGQGNPAGQSETLTNSGGSALNWQVSFDARTAFWLRVVPVSGSLAAQQSAQFVAQVNANGLATGIYSAQITVSATDTVGVPVANSPQFFTVTLTVVAPCTLQISPGSVTFSVILLNPNPPDQAVTVSESGNCARPVTWSASVNASSSAWLSVRNSTGKDNGSGSTIEVHVNTQGMLIGTYNGSITIYAVGNGNAPVQASPQTVTVTLTVLKL